MAEDGRAPDGGSRKPQRTASGWVGWVILAATIVVLSLVFVTVADKTIVPAVQEFQAQETTGPVTCSGSCGMWPIWVGILGVVGAIYLGTSLALSTAKDETPGHGRCHACRAKLREPLHCYSCGEPQKDSAWGRS